MSPILSSARSRNDWSNSRVADPSDHDSSQFESFAIECIRPEQPNDHLAIGDVNRAAFGGSAEAELVRAIRATNGFDVDLSLVALLDQTVVGHILFSPISIVGEAALQPALALAPICVLPDHQRKGIGSRLVRLGLDRCRSKGHEIIIVLGHPAFYPRFGFRRASEFGISAPFEVREDSFMALGLNDSTTIKPGTARYSAPFGI